MKNSGNLDKDICAFKGPILVYNRDRSICSYISSDNTYYTNIVREIISKGVGGLKGYFNAIRENDCLKINYKRIQVPETW